MEIIGVLFVVLIIGAGMIFFLASKSKIDTKQDLSESQLSQAILNAILPSTTDCGPELSRVIENCYGKNTLCGNSCKYATDKMLEMMDGSLGKWQKPYRIYTNRGGKILIDIDKCGNYTEKVSSGIFLIPQEKKNIVVTLDICKI
jgi:hypothetical protein